MSNPQYTAEFKAEAIKQVIDRGHTVVDVAAPSESAEMRRLTADTAALDAGKISLKQQRVDLASVARHVADAR